MKNKFDFYEIVMINSDLDKHKKINSKHGVVIGMVEDEHGKWFYAVTIEDDGWDIEEKYLISTGKFSSRDQFYIDSDDYKIKVIVNEKGEGSIKDE